MSCTRPLTLRATAFFVLAATLAVCGTARGQLSRDGDLLEQARRLREVAAQRLEADVRDALRQAQSLEPAKAVALLRHTLASVEQDTSLSAERRDALKGMLLVRLRALGADLRTTPAPDTTGRAIQDANRRAEDLARSQEQEQIDRSMATIRSLQSQGRFDEADRMSRDLVRRFPSNLAAQAAARISPAMDRAIDLRNLRDERERRYARVGADVERSAIPAAGDLEVPADFQKRMRERDKLLVKINDKDKALIDALNSPISVEFKPARFQEVITELERVSGQAIVIDRPSLDEANVTYETPVNLQLKRVTFRTALRKVLSDLGLAYIIKDGVIQVMTPIKAREQMTARAYYVGDLMFVAGYILTPGLSQLQMAQNVAQLIDLIQRTIDPSSWQVNGGNGSITFYPATMSLVIKQSAEMHFILGSGLSGR